MRRSSFELFSEAMLDSFRGLQHFVLDENGAIEAQSQGERIAGARIERHHFAVALHPDQRVKRIVFQFGDHDFLHVDVEADQDILQQVVRHRAGGLDFFNFQRDGVGFVDADPDRQHAGALRFLQDDNGHVGHGIHHQTSDFDFEFHDGPL